MVLSSKHYLILCAVAILWAGAADYHYRASGAPTRHAAAPAVDCSSLVLTMADCLSYVSNGSTVEKPEGSCCSGLKTVLKADVQCLCEAFRSSAQLGVILNVTKALALPSACKVSAVSATNCGLSITPASSPMLSPESSPLSDSSAVPSITTPAITAPAASSDEVSPPATAPALGIAGSSEIIPSVGLLLFSLALVALLL